MQQELKENITRGKLLALAKQAPLPSSYSQLLDLIQAAYNLALQESAEKIEAQAELIETYEKRWIEANPKLGERYIDSIAKNYQSGN